MTLHLRTAPGPNPGTGQRPPADVAEELGWVFVQGSSARRAQAEFLGTGLLATD